MRLMGQVAARWAVDMVTKNDRPSAHRLQVRLVIRSSSAGRNGDGLRIGLTEAVARGPQGPLEHGDAMAD
jgi:hypothetical protein